MPKTWIETTHEPPPESFRLKIGGHPLVAQRLSELGFDKVSAALGFIDPSQYTPSHPNEFPELIKAADRVLDAIHKNETILVWGDFDVDGQTATALLVEALREISGQVVYHIPVRAVEGHGIRKAVLEKLLDRSPKPRLLITCDTGISEFESVDYATVHGVDVIITDHHELAGTLPNAFAILNTHLLPSGHPLDALPGVGIAYKFIEELFNRNDKQRDLAYYLDLVALGIVSDVAMLRGDTRYLLQLGLEALQQTNRLGLRTLIEAIGIDPGQIDEDQIGYSIAPRLNALGRLSEAGPIVDFFTTKDLSRARIFASQLEGLNQRRRLLTDQVYQGALAQLEREPSLLGYSALVLAHPGWPNGVVGIVASRLAEKFDLPTVLLNIQNEDLASGSARSIEGIHIAEAISEQADLLISYGGHAGAAGLSLPITHIPDFRSRLSRTIRRMVKKKGVEPSIKIDGHVNLEELSIDFIEDLEVLAPFGPGNPHPVLVCQNLRVINHTPIGRTGEHLKLVVGDQQDNLQEVIWWNGAGETIPPENTLFNLAFSPRSHTFRGEKSVQLQWVDYQIAESSISEVETRYLSREIIDYRNEKEPHQLLDALRSRQKILVWAEGNDKSITKGRNRNQLQSAKSLAIWTTPPGYWEVQAVLEQVNPITVYIFAQNPEIDSPQAFLARLAGLLKHVLNAKGGKTSLNELAANTAHTVGTVRMGLFWLGAKGVFEINCENTPEEGIHQTVMAKRGTGVAREELPEITAELIIMLEETAAFRRYFEQTNVNSLT
jgi:single-stranded-DNA-specific exonuclease